MSLSIEKLREKVLLDAVDDSFNALKELIQLVPAAKLRKHYDFIDEEE